MKARAGPFGTNLVLSQQRTSSRPNAFHLAASSSPSMLSTKAATQLFASTTDDVAAPSTEAESEVDRLRAMAARLRAEAASLEAQKAQDTANATQRAYAKFDTNSDGQVTLDELKAGLEKAWKAELPDTRVKQLMDVFDVSGDGVLQVDEFVSIDQFRTRMESMIRDEQVAAKDLQRQAKVEEEAAQLAEARSGLINDSAPTNTDKVVSALPYLLPLLDGLAFGRHFFEGHESNPAVVALATVLTLYRSIPFGGLVAYLGLNTLTGNFKINRLVRFNMKQAIYLDIALFVPGLIASLSSVIGSGIGVEVPSVISEVGSDAVFVALVASIGYSVVSSLLGVTPDKIPQISNSVNERMPSIDMFDAEGRFIPPTSAEDDESSKDDTN